MEVTAAQPSSGDRLRVALVLYGGVHRSGRESVIPAVVNLVERLALRHELHVFALAQYPEPCTYPLLGATVHNLAAMPAPPGLGMIRALSRLLRAMAPLGRFDLLHAYMGVPAGAVTVAAGRRLGLPVIVTFDGNELVALPEINYGLNVRLRGRLLRRTIGRMATQITVCTRYMARLARERGIEATVIPLGIVPAHAPAAPPLSEGPPWRLLHVANLNPVKDQPTLLRALVQVRAAGLDVHLDIVGVDTLDGVIQKECARLGLADHVTFHGGKPADEVWPYYPRAHLHLLPSRHDAAGVAVLEAAACGVPTVGSNVGYMAEWAEAGAARAVPVGDADALARAIIELLADGVSRRRMGAAAAALVRARDADWTAARFEALYREVKGR
jgi:glycosyltransferase involved in cell wall biosynthesis